MNYQNLVSVLSASASVDDHFLFSDDFKAILALLENDKATEEQFLVTDDQFE